MTANRSRSNSPSPRKRSRSNSPTSRKKARVDTTDQPTAGNVDADTPPVDDIEAYLRQLAADMTGDQPNPLTAAQPSAVPRVVAQTPVAPPKPENPFVGQVAALRANFGQGDHEKFHFSSTIEKKHHGVWRQTKGEGWTQKLKRVKAWVNLALDSINANDDFVVASKPGKDGGHNYLVHMGGEKVGHLSGSSVPKNQKPPAHYIEVYLNRNGQTVSAFPSDPSIF